MSKLRALHQFSPNFELISCFYLPLSLTRSCSASPMARPTAPCGTPSVLTENCWCAALRVDNARCVPLH